MLLAGEGSHTVPTDSYWYVWGGKTGKAGDSGFLVNADGCTRRAAGVQFWKARLACERTVGAAFDGRDSGETSISMTNRIKNRYWHVSTMRAQVLSFPRSCCDAGVNPLHSGFWKVLGVPEAKGKNFTCITRKASAPFNYEITCTKIKW